MKYKFTVIIPVYNIEKYLKESIKSIVKQNIGFKENIQLILVNDGSTDKSEKICKKYEKKYPDNVIYIYQENKGVSEARNSGIPLIKGKYVNFFDGDDKWEKDAFEKVWNFFEEHYKKIDVVSCRQKMFEAKNEYIPLDYKFGDKNKIADINITPDAIHASVTSSFFKSEVVKKYKYDSKLVLGEDSKFLNTIILEKGKYGLLRDVTHQFRKRKNGSSATQNLLEKETRYTNTVKYYYNYFYDYSKNKYGKIIPYIQFLIMNAIKYRVSQQIPDSIDKKIVKNYQENIIDIIKETDDDVIINIKKSTIYTKIYLLKLKYQNEIIKHINVDDNNIMFDNKKIGKIPTNKVLFIEKIDFKDNKCTITGRLKTPLLMDNIKLYLKNSNDSTKVNLIKNDSLSKKSFINEPLDITYNFSIETKLKINTNNLMFFLNNNGFEIPLLPNFDNKKLGKISKKPCLNNRKIIFLKKNTIVIKTKTLKRYIKYIIMKNN